MSAPLSRFNPKWTGVLRKDSGEGITLDCPICGPSHRLAAYFDNPLDGQSPAPWIAKEQGKPEAKVWHREGEDFASLTVEPSLNYPCFHGWIEDGQVIHISEATHRGQLADGRIVSLSPRQVRLLRAAGKIQ